MLLKVGATDLVLRMIEAGTVMRDLTLENPIRAIREVSHDITGRRKVRLASGREASALDIQQEYYSKAVEFCERRGIRNGVTEQVLELWGRALDAIGSGGSQRNGHIDDGIRQRWHKGDGTRPVNQVPDVGRAIMECLFARLHLTPSPRLRE